MKKLCILFLLAFTFYNTQAQVILWDSVTDRKLPFLKNEDKMNVEFVYDGALINGKDEVEFLGNRQEEFNTKKDGRGDNFVQHWQDVKTKRYPEHFEKSFKKTARKKMKISQGNDQNYKLLVKLVKAKTGEGIYVKTVPATVDFEISIIETATKKVMATGRILNVKGMVKAKSNIGGKGQVMRIVARSMNADVANRLAQCYNTAGITTAKYIVRFNKKKK